MHFYTLYGPIGGNLEGKKEDKHMCSVNLELEVLKMIPAFQLFCYYIFFMVCLYYLDCFNLIFLILITIFDVGGTYIIFVLQIRKPRIRETKDLLKVTCLSGKTVIKIRAQIFQLIVHLVLFLLHYF